MRFIKLYSVTDTSDICVNTESILVVTPNPLSDETVKIQLAGQNHDIIVKNTAELSDMVGLIPHPVQFNQKRKRGQDNYNNLRFTN